MIPTTTGGIAQGTSASERASARKRSGWLSSSASPSARQNWIAVTDPAQIRPLSHRGPVATARGNLTEPRAHPLDSRAQLVMVQLEHLAQHGPLEHAGQALGVAAGDLRIERIERPAAGHRAGIGM